MKEAKTIPQRRFISLWNNGLRELVIVGFVFLCYRISSGVLSHGFDQAYQNACDIINLEKTLGIFFEQDFQSFFVKSTFLIHAVNTIYTICYYPALIIFVIWAFVYHRQEYIFVRNVFIVSAAIAFTCFALYPVAPPRLLPPEFGFIDLMETHGIVYSSSTFMSRFTNPYAAMPSCHFGFTLLIGVATVHMTKSWWLKIVGALVPLLMLISIVATANHYILDAVGGAVTIGLAYGAVRILKTVCKREPSLNVENMD